MSGTITEISGPQLRVRGLDGARLGDLVRAGAGNIPGEIISIRGEEAAVRLWEEPRGLGLGEPVETAGEPPMVELGPGLLGQVFDACQRPMHQTRPKGNAPETTGTALDRRREWDFLPSVAVGQIVRSGDVLGTVQETAQVCHKILVPQGLSGVVAVIQRGKHSLEEPVAVIKDEKGGLHDITMLRRWPLRSGRPWKARLFSGAVLSPGPEGQPPLTKGVSAVLMAPRGGGKSRFLRALGRCAAADVLVCIGCGERGSELRAWMEDMRAQTEAAGGSRMERCVFVAWPVDRASGGREAAVHTGLAVGEYFRDMGLDVLILLDSLNRWTETMPPAERENRLARFFAAMGEVDCLGGGHRRGSLSLCAAVSSEAEATVKACRRQAGLCWTLEPAEEKMPQVGQEEEL